VGKIINIVVSCWTLSHSELQTIRDKYELTETVVRVSG